MFSLSLLFAFLAVTAAANYDSRGREYVYRYSGQVLAGFPDKEQRQYSAKVYDTIVRVQPKGEYSVFKIEDAKYAYALLNGNPDEVVQQQQYEYKDVPENAAYIEQPFKVYFKNGQVVGFQVRKDEPTHSVNLKRGLISLFHLDFDSAQQSPRHYGLDYEKQYRNYPEYDHSRYQSDYERKFGDHRDQRYVSQYEYLMRGYGSHQRYQNVPRRYDAERSQYESHREGPSQNYNKYDDEFKTQRYDPEYQNHRYDPEHKNQDYDPENKNQHYDPEYKNQRYDTEYKNQRYDPEYKNRRYDPEYKNQRYDPEYKNQHFDKEYKNQPFEKEYRNQPFDKEYRNKHFDEEYKNKPFDEEYKNQRPEQVHRGDEFRNQRFDRDYGNQHFGEESGKRYFDDESRNQHFRDYSRDQRFVDDHRRRFTGRDEQEYQRYAHRQNDYERTHDRTKRHAETDRFQYEQERRQRRFEGAYGQYRTLEESLLGECETEYVVEHLPHVSAPYERVLNVTKSRNLHRCRQIPAHFFFTSTGERCHGGELYDEKEHEQVHHGNAYYRYSIRGDLEDYVIERVVAENEVSYTPYPMKGQSAAVFTNRTLELLEEKYAGKDLEPQGPFDSYNSLQFEIPYRIPFKAQVDLRRPHYLYDVLEKKAGKEGIIRIFEDLLHVYDDETYEQRVQKKNHPVAFLELVRQFSTLGYEEIKDIYETVGYDRQQSDEEKQNAIRSLFNDVLVATGTNPAILFQKYLIKNGKVSTQDTIYFFSSLRYHVKEVTEALLDEILDTCETDYVKEHTSAYTGCYYTLASIVYDKCGVKNVARYYETKPDRYSCFEDTAVKYLRYIATVYERVENEHEKIAFLRAIGLLGLRESLDILKDTIHGHGKPSLYERVAAIDAVEAIGQNYPEEVYHTLLPVFFNQSDEHHEVRIAAFVQILKLVPQTYQLETIAKSLLDDEDDQVRSYVYSALVALARSTHHCDRKLSHAAKYALASLERYHEDFEKYDHTYSKIHYYGAHDDDYNYGSNFLLDHIASDTGYIPRKLYFEVNDFLRGKYANTFGFGFRQYGLEKYFDKFVGPEGEINKSTVFSGPSGTYEENVDDDVERERTVIREKLNLPVTEYEPVHGEVFLKLKGRDLPFFYFDEHTFGGFLHKLLLPAFARGPLPVPISFDLPTYRFQHFVLAEDQTYVLPSEAGLALLFEQKQSVHIYNDVKESQFSLGASAVTRQDQQQRGVNGEVQFRLATHVIFDHQTVESIGVVVPFDQKIFGVGINERHTLSLPFKAEFALDLGSGKFNHKFTPIVPHEIFHYHTEPYTFVDSYENDVPFLQEETYYPLNGEQSQKQVAYDYFHQEIGVGFHVDADYDVHRHFFQSLFDFFVTQDPRNFLFEVQANPELEPYHLDIVFEPADKDVTRNIEVQFQYDFYRDLDSTDDADTDVHSGEEGYQGFSISGVTEDFHKTVIRAEIVANGDVERRSQFMAVYARHVSGVYHKFDIHFERTPFARYETEGFKLCYSGYFQYPEYDYGKLMTLDVSDYNKVALGEAKIHFGKNCHDDAKVIVETKFEPSEEQVFFNQHKNEKYDAKYENPFAYYYQKCIQDGQEGRFPEHCMTYLEEYLKFHQYTVQVKHQNVPEYFRYFLHKFDDLFKIALYPHGEHHYVEVHNPDDEFTFYSNFSVNKPIGDIFFKKPQSESQYTDVFVPAYTPFRSFPSNREFDVKKSVNNHFCLLHDNGIMTLDKYVYDVPESSCYAVLAKDCSPSENFVVLTKAIKHRQFNRAVKVILGDHKVEIFPVTTDSELAVFVDGQKVRVDEQHPYYYYYKDEKKGEPIFSVYKSFSFYTIESTFYGISTFTDGRIVYFVNSIYYRSKLCGLCGNYNGQKYDDYDLKYDYAVSREYAHAYRYVVPSEDCDAVPQLEEYTPEHKIDHVDTEETSCLYLKNKVISIPTRRIPLTCFTVRPIQTCRPGCLPTRTVSQRVGVHCLNAGERTAKELEQAHGERILYEIQRKKQDFEVDVSVAENCYRA